MFYLRPTVPVGLPRVNLFCCQKIKQHLISFTKKLWLNRFNGFCFVDLSFVKLFTNIRNKDKLFKYYKNLIYFFNIIKFITVSGQIKPNSKFTNPKPKKIKIKVLA